MTSQSTSAPASTDETARPVAPEATALVARLAEAARTASHTLALADRARKDAALTAMGDALVGATEQILSANAVDLERGRGNGLPTGMLDRLTLDEERIEGIADALRELAGLPDPVGEVVRGSVLPNGLELRQVRVPMGVLGIIYEARPNVTVDAAGLCLKSGNAVLLRGGSAAQESNRALVAVLRGALEGEGLPADAVALVDEGGRDGARALMRAHGLVDVIIPRGSAGLIDTVVRESIVPVIETGAGNVHVYVDAAADLQKAERIVLNAKVQRPSVCNAAETLLVHESLAGEFLPRVLADLAEAGVALHGDERTRDAAPAGVVVGEATDELYDTEFNALEMTVKVVRDLDEAVAHVRRFGTGHTEAIVTDDRRAAREWTARVDAAAVMVNASTRFTDGGEFGFGAEIGISTQKLHARGPMGLPEMTTTKWIVEGDGQTRE